MYELKTLEQEQPLPQPETEEYLGDGDWEAERGCGRTRPWGLPHFANHPYRACTPTPEYNEDASEYTASVAQVIRINTESTEEFPACPSSEEPWPLSLAHLPHNHAAIDLPGLYQRSFSPLTDPWPQPLSYTPGRMEQLEPRAEGETPSDWWHRTHHVPPLRHATIRIPAGVVYPPSLRISQNRIPLDLIPREPTNTGRGRGQRDSGDGVDSGAEWLSQRTGLARGRRRLSQGEDVPNSLYCKEGLKWQTAYTNVGIKDQTNTQQLLLSDQNLHQSHLLMKSLWPEDQYTLLSGLLYTIFLHGQATSFQFKTWTKIYNEFLLQHPVPGQDNPATDSQLIGELQKAIKKRIRNFMYNNKQWLHNKLISPSAGKHGHTRQPVEIYMCKCCTGQAGYKEMVKKVQARMLALCWEGGQIELVLTRGDDLMAHQSITTYLFSQEPKATQKQFQKHALKDKKQIQKLNTQATRNDWTPKSFDLYTAFMNARLMPLLAGRQAKDPDAESSESEDGSDSDSEDKAEDRDAGGLEVVGEKMSIALHKDRNILASNPKDVVMLDKVHMGTCEATDIFGYSATSYMELPKTPSINQTNDLNTSVSSTDSAFLIEAWFNEYCSIKAGTGLPDFEFNWSMDGGALQQNVINASAAVLSSSVNQTIPGPLLPLAPPTVGLAQITDNIATLELQAGMTSILANPKSRISPSSKVNIQDVVASMDLGIPRPSTVDLAHDIVTLPQPLSTQPAPSPVPGPQYPPQFATFDLSKHLRNKALSQHSQTSPTWLHSMYLGDTMVALVGSFPDISLMNHFDVPSDLLSLGVNPPQLPWWDAPTPAGIEHGINEEHSARHLNDKQEFPSTLGDRLVDRQVLKLPMPTGKENWFDDSIKELLSTPLGDKYEECTNLYFALDDMPTTNPNSCLDAQHRPQLLKKWLPGDMPPGHLHV
ncbi:hypothetical protein EDD18DRAFT_1355423 [Armillaria luteobubalina]|uniref:Uncharacterized protein n=1 Tax=Armillaria luteobubalina TaxID=153913 RepID=A0AA39URV7_9AGAR|nr:hypothetical protein EDD18DRAFT_1355423 [Armillaria luteobubalina]